LSESEPIVHRPDNRGAKITRIHPGKQTGNRAGNRAGSHSPGSTGSANGHQTVIPICFNRHEINRIMNVYGRKVAQGEWRDYAIDMLRDRAVFSIFRHASEFPLYRIEKNPKLARRQGAYSVITSTGLILKRGRDLTQVLRVIDRQLQLVKV